MKNLLTPKFRNTPDTPTEKKKLSVVVEKFQNMGNAVKNRILKVFKRVPLNEHPVGIQAQNDLRKSGTKFQNVYAHTLKEIEEMEQKHSYNLQIGKHEENLKFVENFSTLKLELEKLRSFNARSEFSAEDRKDISALIKETAMKLVDQFKAKVNFNKIVIRIGEKFIEDKCTGYKQYMQSLEQSIFDNVLNILKNELSSEHFAQLDGAKNILELQYYANVVTRQLPQVQYKRASRMAA